MVAQVALEHLAKHFITCLYCDQNRASKSEWHMTLRKTLKTCFRDKAGVFYKHIPAPSGHGGLSHSLPCWDSARSEHPNALASAIFWDTPLSFCSLALGASDLVSVSSIHALYVDHIPKTSRLGRRVWRIGILVVALLLAPLSWKTTLPLSADANGWLKLPEKSSKADLSIMLFEEPPYHTYGDGLAPPKPLS